MSEQLMPQGGGDRGKRSCCFYGCIGLVVASILLAVVAAGVGYFVYRQVVAVVEQITEPQPVELPVTELAPADQEALETKLADLNAALEDQSDEKTFMFNADELNGLLDSRQDLPFGDWVHLSIEDGTVTGQVSLPLSETPVAFLGQGRYFNGTGTFDVSIANGALRVFLIDAEMKGEEIPAEALQQIRGQNLAKDVHDPQLDALFAKVKELRVEGDHIVLELN